MFVVMLHPCSARFAVVCNPQAKPVGGLVAFLRGSKVRFELQPTTWLLYFSVYFSLAGKVIQFATNTAGLVELETL